MAKAASSTAVGNSPAALIGEVSRQSGLGQAALARRAGLPRSVLNAYARGRREPGAAALMRIAAAAGLRLELAPHVPPVDPERAGRLLEQVLDLAEALPFRRRGALRYPALPAAADPRGRRRP